MAARPTLRGYRPIPGPSRRYLTPSGGSISRRQYDNLRARMAGFRNRYELETFRAVEASSDWVGDIYAHNGEVTWMDYANIMEVKRRRAAIRDRYGDGPHSRMDPYDPELIAPDGPLDRLLAASGKRAPNGRPVGNS